MHLLVDMGYRLTEILLQSKKHIFTISITLTAFSLKFIFAEFTVFS